MRQKKVSFFGIVNALALREIQTRFGSKIISYFWALAEPVVQVLVFLAIKYYFFGVGTIPNYPVFLIIGILSFNLFKNILNSSINAFEANKSLFIYPQVKPIHTIVSRILVELLIFSILLVGFAFFGTYLGLDFKPNDSFLLLLGLCLLILFASSLGIMLSVLSFLNKTVKNIVGLSFTPLLFASAVFYSVEKLPQGAREILELNPLTHYMELIHYSMINGLSLNFVSYLFIAASIILPLFIGLFLYEKLERRIKTHD